MHHYKLYIPKIVLLCAWTFKILILLCYFSIIYLYSFSFQSTFAELESVPVPQGFPTGEYEGQDAYNRMQYCHQNGMYFSQEDNNQGYQNTYDNVNNGAENTEYQYQKDSNQGYAQNDVQLAAGNQGNWHQEQQGFNNIGYQNYSNQGYAPNAENQGYSNSADSSFEENVAQGIVILCGNFRFGLIYVGGPRQGRKNSLFFSFPHFRF